MDQQLHPVRSNALPFSIVSCERTLLASPLHHRIIFILAGIKKGTKAQSAGERRHLTLLSLHWHNTLPLLLSYLRSRSERNIRSGPFGKDGTVAICETMKSKTKEKVWTSSWDLMTKTDPSSMALFGTRSARHAVQPAFSFLVSMCKLYAACRSRCRRCALRQTPKS